MDIKIIGLLLLCVSIGGVVGYGSYTGAIDWCQLANYGCVDDGEGVEQTTPGTTVQPTQPIVIQPTYPTTVPTTTGALPVETLKGSVKNKYTMGNPAATVYFDFYAPGADVADPNVAALDTITVTTSGVGNTTNFIIQTQTAYDLHFNGTSTYYDEKINNWNINYNPETGIGYLLIGGLSYYPAVAVGTFVDVDSLPEVESNGTCAIDGGTDTINYSAGGCSGSMWIKVDVGNSASNTELHDVVMCFRDSDGDMEGNEATTISAAYVSGTNKISIPGSLLGYWKEGMGTSAKRCIKIASVVGSSEKARWELDFTINEGNFAATEEFEITFDDLGDVSQKQYPSWDAKATAESLTVQYGE